ncbi:hypothetical protein BDF21DRAFT_400461 [Thamnidium elegans]|nr:hypothetical protein BDF21DRAFT_400461 [Thamnidium elegans]
MYLSKLTLLVSGLFQTAIAIEQKYHVVTRGPQNAVILPVCVTTVTDCNFRSTTSSFSNTAPTSTPSCISGSYGKNKGDGYKNYCCKTSDDCWESCIKRKCNGYVKPSSTITRTSSTTSNSPTSAPTCASGSFAYKTPYSVKHGNKEGDITSTVAGPDSLGAIWRVMQLSFESCASE